MHFRRLRFLSGALRSLACVVVATLAAASGRAEPVSFTFPVEPLTDVEAEFAREIFAEVITPSGRRVRLPAFPERSDRWTVHARADEAGEYRLGSVVEDLPGGQRVLRPTDADPVRRRVKTPITRPAIQRDPRDTSRFLAADGSTYTPLGANLAWADGPRVAWHLDAFREFEANGLNWTRIWMAHWGGTNLDWLPRDMGPSPAPGTLDRRVAANWDRILEAAARHGVYVQVVLQHHGQYTTGANSNWAINPWNAAHPAGFLQHPAEFFTSPRAAALTRQKYRYIVARWAHSPAVLAWELFNEVHWTNGYMEDEPAVAAWHREMADYIRAIDPYHHLITTSLDDLESPIYAAMDYYQPHLYAINMLTSVRAFEKPFSAFDRPVFWGEIGDDKMPVSGEEKSGGSQLVPQVWASLMGPGPLPGQSWLGEVFVRTRRVRELGAVSRFLTATELAVRHGLRPFSPAVEAEETMPLTLIPGYDWGRHRPSRAAIPLDGRDSLATIDIPAILVGNPRSVAEGYPAAFTLDLEIPRETRADVVLADAAARGATLEVLVDDTVAGSHSWPAVSKPYGAPAPAGTPRPATISIRLEPGTRRLTLRNTGGEDWVRLERITFDLPSPRVAAAGKRNDDFIALWVWDKRDVHALDPKSPTRGRLLVPDVPAGRWTLTWWDADRGVPRTESEIDHPGGTLRLETPAIARHAAAVLTRR